jgi:hypothetical protein
MAAIDAERYLDNLPVPTPTGEEITMDGDRVMPNHQIVIMADGKVMPNLPEDVPGEATAGD